MTNAVNATLYTAWRTTLVRDFSAVTLLATSPSMVVVHPSLPVRSLADAGQARQARPGALITPRPARDPHFLAAEMFKTRPDNI